MEEKLNDPAIEAKRRETCNGCKFRDVQADMCKRCGCFLDLKIASKTNRNKFGDIVITHCPEGKWDDTEIAEYYDKTKK